MTKLFSKIVSGDVPNFPVVIDRESGTSQIKKDGIDVKKKLFSKIVRGDVPDGLENPLIGGESIALLTKGDGAP